MPEPLPTIPQVPASAMIASNLQGRRLVLFGAGYVGGAFAREAVEHGLRVTALTRNVEKARVLRDLGVEVVIASLESADWHSRLPPGADFAVNCVSSGGGGTAAYEQSYLQGMKSICAWTAGARIGVFAYTSSTSVYPQGGGAVVTEDDPADADGDGPAVLRRTERLVESDLSPHSDRIFIFRLAGIYGPGRHHVLDQLREGATTLPGRGEHRLNLIHRDDICRALWAALGSPPTMRNEIFNLADDAPTPKGEVVAWLCERLGRPAPAFDGHATPGRRALVPDRVIANRKIRALLDWRPRYPSFREGYKAILEA